MNILKECVYSIEKGKQCSIDFIIKNKSMIKEVFGIQLLREIIINHNSHFNSHKGEIIFFQYKKYIMSKNKKHNSDLMIGLNILRNFKIKDSYREEIINFLFGKYMHITSNLTSNMKYRLLLHYTKTEKYKGIRND